MSCWSKVVLFILTLLTSVIQLVMRMIRLGSGQLLQRYRRVGVMLANQPLQSAGGINNSGSGGGYVAERLSRRLTELSGQNNNNNDDDDDNIGDDNGTVVGGVA